MEKPKTGRNQSFTKVLNILNKTYSRPITIVETGCIRNTTDEARFGDGWSTLNWEYYAKQTNSKVFVVDIDENHLNKAKQIVEPSKYITYIQDDSVSYLRDFLFKIDVLFLDSYDYCGDAENVKKCHMHSLNEILAAWDKLNDLCFILIDDVFNDSWDGKGKLSIPYLLDHGFVLVYQKDNQVLLKRTN